MLAEYYSSQGYRVEHVGTGAVSSKFDGGIDLKLFKNGQFTLVQCKHWNVKQVPHNEVHQLIGVMTTQRANFGILVTSGEFTEAARLAARKYSSIELIDGPKLRRMLGEKNFALNTISTRSGYREISVVNNIILNRFIKKFIVTVIFAIFLVFMVKVITNTAIVDLQKNLSGKPKAHVESQMPQPKSYVPSPGDKNAINVPVAEIAPADKAMTPEQLHEWEKKNAESMKILEESTPDIAK